MEKRNFQQQVNDISSYVQINKAFRHVYGSAAAAVLSSLINKYTFYKEKQLLKSIKTKSGKKHSYFFISKSDLALDCGISISSLEKNNNNNPLTILENLGLIFKIKQKKNHADSFILFPTRIKNEIIKTTTILKKDEEMINSLPRKDRRAFQKALKGKLTRGEIYSKYEPKIESDVEIDIDIEEFETSEEDKNSSFEGILRKYKEISIKKSTKSLKIEPIKSASQFEVSKDLLEETIDAYSKDKINSHHMFTTLVNYIPNNVGFNWQMSDLDETYIKKNLSSAEPPNIDAIIDYIDINIQRMLKNEREMRFGSLLAGIFEKVIESGVEYNFSKSPSAKYTTKEYKEMLKQFDEEDEKIDYSFLDEVI